MYVVAAALLRSRRRISDDRSRCYADRHIPAAVNFTFVNEHAVAAFPRKGSLRRRRTELKDEISRFVCVCRDRSVVGRVEVCSEGHGIKGLNTKDEGLHGVFQIRDLDLLRLTTQCRIRLDFAKLSFRALCSRKLKDGVNGRITFSRHCVSFLPITFFGKRVPSIGTRLSYSLAYSPLKLSQTNLLAIAFTESATRIRAESPILWNPMSWKN